VKSSRRRRADVILLKDLAPRTDVRGGAGKRVFGEPVESRREGTQTERKRKSPGKPKS